ncbi:hypothetical protein [Halomonas sp.]|uniref:hypothetical protein n=1 Tax=Halomonas sp. TaxID=1486246 RepID=UPI003A939AA4
MTQTHFVANVPGAVPQSLRVNARGDQGGEMTEQEFKALIDEHLVKPLDALVGELRTAAERQKRISSDIAEIEADQKARGIHQQPSQQLTGNHAGYTDTLPD